jgi:zinc protease
MPVRLLAVYVALLAAAAPSLARADVSATTTTLSNGLTVIVAPIHAAPVVTVGVLYKAGSRDETPWTTGVAHQVEHMMFKGTTDLLKPGDIDRRFYDNNANTDQDSTYYYESFHKDELASALEVEADRMVNAAFDPKQLAAENVVVLAELENADDSPSELLDEQVEAAAMQAHQYHWPTIGWKSIVASFATHRDLVYDFYVRHYAPQNAVLVIAGDVDSDAALALVHKYFDGVSERPVAALQQIVEPAQHGVRRVNVVGAGSANRLEMAYHVPGTYTDESYVLQVLDAVLAGGQSSRLYQTLIDDGYGTDLETAPSEAYDPYLYTITVTLAQGVTPDDARSVIERELRKLARWPIGDAELRRAKKQVVAAYVFQHDGVEALAQWLARWQAWTGDWRNDERFVARTDAVTAAQIEQAVRQYMTPDNVTIGTYTARSSRASWLPHGSIGLGRHRAPGVRASAGAWVGAGARDMQLADGQSAQVSGSPARFVLPNGLALIVAENHVNPSAVIETFTQAGSAYDPPSRCGLAALTQEMLTRGTTSKTYEQLQDAFDALGLTVNTSITLAGSNLSTQTLAADEPQTMALMADMLQHPRFDPQDFSDAKAQLIDDRRSARDDPLLVARDQMYREMYPSSNPWSRPSTGTPGGLAAVRRADVQSAYQAHYGPNVTVIIVAGDVETAAVRAQVERLFGSWRRIKATDLQLEGAAASTSLRRVNAIVNGTSQVEVSAGAPGVAPNAPDLEAAELMNFILGGGSFVSKLLHQVRDVDGYVYDIGSRFSDSPAGGGPWSMSFGADRRDVDKAIDEAIVQMRALQNGPLSDDDLAQFRRLAADAVITGEVSDQGLADELLREERLGLGLDYAQRLPQIYGAITPAQIQDAARKYLQPDGLTVSTAGPP